MNLHRSLPYAHKCERRQAHYLAYLVLLPWLLIASVALQADETKAATGEFLGAMDTVYPDWFKVSFMELEEDIAEAAEEGKRLMLVFHQDGCPYCNAFVERNLAQSDIEQTLKTKFDVIEINMWGDREVVSMDGKTYSEKEFAAVLQVQFTPTVLFLTEEGGLSLRLNGYYDPDKFRIALDYVTNKMEGELSFNEYAASRNESKSSKSLTTREYFTGAISDLSDRGMKGDKPLLLIFEQGTCKNCETLHEKILSKPESQVLLAGFDVYQIDMWGREPFKTPAGEQTTGRQWSKAMNINYAPTMILYSADGTEVIRSESFFKTFHNQSILDYVSSDSWREEPSFQRYLSERADKLREEGHAVNIWD
jgi:thioredoxin-related protein